MALIRRCTFLLLVLFSIGFGQTKVVYHSIYLFKIIDDSLDLKLKQPKGISVDLSGMIYVADSENNRILKFDKEGKLIKTVGGFGWEKEQFYTPFDIAASSGLDVFVADYNNHRIQRYDKDLNYISSLYSDKNWDDQLQFAYPKSVAVSIHGDLFLIDSENIRILKFNSFGEPELSFGDYAQGKGRLIDPVQIAVSADDKIYVSDRAADRIKVFDYFGNYLTEIGTGVLDKPTGVFYSRRKLLFVVDSGNSMIRSFDPKGHCVFQCSKISSSNEFKNLVDMVTFEDRLFVLDQDQIYVFELK